MAISSTPLAAAAGPKPITVVSHTNLVYWWPVWLVGFILAGLTYGERARLVVVPAGTTIKEVEPRAYELTVPPKATDTLAPAATAAKAGHDAFPVPMASSKNYGIVYVGVLLLVIFAVNVPLRGLASVVAILVIFLVVALFSYLDWWEPILGYLGGLHIQISVAGYLLPSVVLFLLWLATFFLYDPLRYMTFTPGQLAVHKDIGDQRQVYDTVQVEVQKRRSDLFRHWVLGLGAGDLIIRIPAQAIQIELPNVLFVGQRVNLIADMMRTKVVLPQ